MANSMDKIREFFGLQPVTGYSDEYIDEYEQDRPSHDLRDRHADAGYYSRDARLEDREYAGRDARAEERDYAPSYARARREPSVVRITLASFLQARQIGDTAREGDIVVYDISALSKADAQRTVDFAQGVQVAIEGQTKKLSARLYALIPKDVELDEDQLDQLREGSA